MLSTWAPSERYTSAAVADRTLDLGIDVVEEERLADGEPEPADAVLEPRERVVRRDPGGGLVARVDALERLVDERGVLHRPGQRSHRVECEAQWIDAGAAHASHGRLEADRAAEGGGQADRATRVAPERHGNQPGRDGDGRAAGGSARDVVRGVPGIVRRPLVVIHAHPAERELDRVGLADQHHAGAGEAPDHGGVLLRDVAGQEPGARGGRHTPDVEQVLRRVGDAIGRVQVLPAPQGELGRARLRQRAFPGHRDEGVEAAVESRDPVEKRLRQRDQAERAGADLRGERGDQFKRQGGIRHESLPSGSAGPRSPASS